MKGIFSRSRVCLSLFLVVIPLDSFAANIKVGNSCLQLRNNSHRRIGCFRTGTRVRILGRSSRRGYVRVELTDSRGRKRTGHMFARYIDTSSAAPEPIPSPPAPVATRPPQPVFQPIIHIPGRPATPPNPFVAPSQEEVFAKITKIADRHRDCANSRSTHRRYNTYRLRQRIGYYHGMTLSFARSVCRNNDSIKQAMLVGGRHDVFDYYRGTLRTYGRDGSEKNLISLYALLLPHGLRESGGDFRDGVDIAAGSSSQTSNTAEAGLCQTSNNVSGVMSREASRVMHELEQIYANNPQACMTDIFSKGLPQRRHRASIGSGEGRRFQELIRSCPALAAEHCAITSRHARHHYGPYKRRETQPMNQCYPMLEEVYDTINADRGRICDALAVVPPPPAEEFQVAERRGTRVVR